MIRVGLRVWCSVPPLQASTWATSAEKGPAASAGVPQSLRPVQRAGFPRGFVRAVSQEALSAATVGNGRTGQPSPLAAAWGYCRDCDLVHSLPKTPRVVEEARRLLDTIRLRGGFDFDSGQPMEPKFSLTTKFPSPVKPKAQGQMLGVMIAETPEGQEVVLKAFSGQMNGEWECPGGWVEPIGRMMKDNPIYKIAQRRIEQLGRDVAQAATEYEDVSRALKAQHGRVPHGSSRASLRAIDARRLRARAAQRDISRALLARIREGYTFSDFRGRTRRLEEASLPQAQLVGGAGDCAAPKLVAAAQRLDLRPTALAEFWCGAPPPSGCRSDGEFYTACEERCQPILGFMLCGLDELIIRARGRTGGGAAAGGADDGRENNDDGGG